MSAPFHTSRIEQVVALTATETTWEYHATSMTQLHKNSEKAQSTVAFAGSSVAGNNIRRTGKASIAEKVKSKRRKMKSSACGDG